MAIEVFNRYENKYVLDDAAYRRFYDRLLEYMEPDDYNKEHPFYSISNIYFDTERDALIRKSLSKPKYKEKLRLRAYGVPGSEAKGYLELKKKVFGLVNKRRTALKLNEAYAFVRTGEPPELKEYMNAQVIEEIRYFLQRYELEPKVYLAYGDTQVVAFETERAVTWLNESGVTEAGSAGFGGPGGMGGGGRGPGMGGNRPRPGTDAATDTTTVQ